MRNLISTKKRNNALGSTMTEAVILIASVALVALASLQVMGNRLDCKLMTAAATVYKPDISVKGTDDAVATAREIGDPCQSGVALVAP